MKKILIILLLIIFNFNLVLAEGVHISEYPPKQEQIVASYVSYTADIKDVNLVLYMNGKQLYTGVLEKINVLWKAFDTKFEGYVDVGLKINQDGSFQTPFIINSSNNKEFDDAALKVLKDVGYFQPLPDGLNQLNMVFSFIKGRPVDYSLYMMDLQTTIKNGWDPPKYLASKKTILLFKIYRDGKIDYVTVYRSSGEEDFDNSCVNQVKKLGYYKPFPNASKLKSMDVLFVFDYQAYQSYRTFPSKVDSADKKLVSYFSLTKNLLILPKSAIVNAREYSYINALKITSFYNDAYLYKYKIDCKKQQIGFKRAYQGPNKILIPLPTAYNDEIKMYSPNKNADLSMIFNYVCEP